MVCDKFTETSDFFASCMLCRRISSQFEAHSASQPTFWRNPTLCADNFDRTTLPPKTPAMYSGCKQFQSANARFPHQTSAPCGDVQPFAQIIPVFLDTAPATSGMRTVRDVFIS